MKAVCLVALLALTSAMAAQIDLDMVELQAVNDPIPRLLQEVLGDAMMPTPGAYSAAAVEKPTEGPEVPEPVPEVTVEAPVPVEAPATPAAPVPIANLTPATPPSTCPEGTSKVSYTFGTLFCVLPAEGAAEGEVYIGMPGKVAVSSGNKCFTEACPAAPAAAATKEVTVSVSVDKAGKAGRKMLGVQAAQRAEFLPFLLHAVHQAETEATGPAETLSHSKCFSVCEAAKPTTIAVLGKGKK